LTPQDKVAAGLETARTYLVVFHHDVTEAQSRSILQNYSTLPADGLLPGQYLMAANSDALARLASVDQVAYVMAGTADMAARGRSYRCGGPMAEAGQIGEYAVVGSGWSKDASGHATVGYYFNSVTSKIDSDLVKSQIEMAFAEWQKYANVTIQAVGQPGAARSIDILFGSHAHGDAYPFDGPGGVLAHTFYPAPVNPDTIAGDMHFDEDENWQVGSGIDLYSVALHEAGHALGLGHSTDPHSVMYPYYQQATGLTSDDIAAIQSLYGAPSSEAAPAAPTSPAAPSAPTTPTSPAAPTAPTTPTSPAAPTTPTQPSQAQPTQPTQPAQPAQPSGSDKTPPSLTVSVPTATIFSTTASSVTVSGTATDNVGVTSVQWSTSNGDSGTASGTTTWSASVPLLQGTNVVTVKAFDAAGNSAWRAVTVVRQ
jgi:hypothetical protein